MSYAFAYVGNSHLNVNYIYKCTFFLSLSRTLTYIHSLEIHPYHYMSNPNPKETSILRLFVSETASHHTLSDV